MFEDMLKGSLPTNLQSMGVLQSMGNPEASTPLPDIVALIAGGLLGWYVVRKNQGMGKYAGVLIGAELGLMILRRFTRPATVIDKEVVDSSQSLSRGG